jgi:hypothetical protein
MTTKDEANMQALDFNRIERLASLMTRIVNGAIDNHHEVVESMIKELHQQLLDWAPPYRNAVGASSAATATAAESTLANNTLLFILLEVIGNGLTLSQKESANNATDPSLVSKFINKKEYAECATLLLESWSEASVLSTGRYYGFTLEPKNAICLAAIKQEHLRLQDLLSDKIDVRDVDICLQQLLRMGLLHAAVSLLNVHFAHAGEATVPYFRRQLPVVRDALTKLAVDYYPGYFIARHDDANNGSAEQIVDLFFGERGRSRGSLSNLPFELLYSKQIKKFAAPHNNAANAETRELVNIDDPLPEFAENLVDAAINPPSPTLFDHLAQRDQMAVLQYFEAIQYPGRHTLQVFFIEQFDIQPFYIQNAVLRILKQTDHSAAPDIERTIRQLHQKTLLLLCDALEAKFNEIQEDYVTLRNRSSRRCAGLFHLDVLLMTALCALYAYQVSVCQSASCQIDDPAFQDNKPLNASQFDGYCTSYYVRNAPTDFRADLTIDQQCVLIPHDADQVCQPRLDKWGLQVNDHCQVLFELNSRQDGFGWGIAAFCIYYVVRLCIYTCFTFDSNTPDLSAIREAIKLLQTEINALQRMIPRSTRRSPTTFIGNTIQPARSCWGSLWYQRRRVQVPDGMRRLATSLAMLRASIEDASPADLLEIKTTDAYDKLAEKYPLFDDPLEEEQLSIDVADDDVDAEVSAAP